MNKLNDKPKDSQSPLDQLYMVDCNLTVTGKIRKLEHVLGMYNVYDFCTSDDLSDEMIDKLALLDLEHEYLIQQGVRTRKLASF